MRDYTTTGRLIRTAAAAAFLALLCGCTGRNFSHPEPDIRIESLENTVLYLSTIKPPRSYENPASLDRAAAFIAQKFREYGLEPAEQKFTARDLPFKNIIASAGPREGGRIIVGAHYDVCGDQPGADDNASAVAGLLEIARFAKKHESELKYRVDFVAYASEEPPFFGSAGMGSYVHAGSLARNNVSVKGMISLEMIGYFTEERGSQSYPLSLLRLFYPSRGNFIGVVSNFGSSGLANQVAKQLEMTSIDVRTLKAPAFVTGVDFSDHRNYWRFGYDAIMVTDTSFYRNPNYHRAADRADTLDFPRMREVVKGICWSIVNVQ